jgi:hypothetical protein
MLPSKGLASSFYGDSTIGSTNPDAAGPVSRREARDAIRRSAAGMVREVATQRHVDMEMAEEAQHCEDVFVRSIVNMKQNDDRHFMESSKREKAHDLAIDVAANEKALSVVDDAYKAEYKLVEDERNKAVKKVAVDKAKVTRDKAMAPLKKCKELLHKASVAADKAKLSKLDEIVKADTSFAIADANGKKTSDDKVKIKLDAMQKLEAKSRNPVQRKKCALEMGRLYGALDQNERAIQILKRAIKPVKRGDLIKVELAMTEKEFDDDADEEDVAKLKKAEIAQRVRIMAAHRQMYRTLLRPGTADRTTGKFKLTATYNPPEALNHMKWQLRLTHPTNRVSVLKYLETLLGPAEVTDELVNQLNGVLTDNRKIYLEHCIGPLGDMRTQVLEELASAFPDEPAFLGNLSEVYLRRKEIWASQQIAQHSNEAADDSPFSGNYVGKLEAIRRRREEQAAELAQTEGAFAFLAAETTMGLDQLPLAATTEGAGATALPGALGVEAPGLPESTFRRSSAQRTQIPS